MAPETPNATIKPFQKSVKKSLFILLAIATNVIILCLPMVKLTNALSKQCDTLLTTCYSSRTVIG
ncbi:MAG TPA: hypothetical protein VH481_01880 [Nitrososphaeraceae archaeon]